jgi:predicted phosphodiesterase
MIRFAVLADIHANLPALQAVLDDICQQSVNATILAGDFITGGPAPSQVLELVSTRIEHVILGNADIRLLDYGKYHLSDLWRGREQWAAMQWTLDHLSKADMRFLAHWSQSKVIEVNGKARVRVVHGSPRAYDEHILPGDHAQHLDLYQEAGVVHDRRIDVGQALDLIQESVLICGHSHIPWQHKSEGRFAMNPGSVGASIDGDVRAHYTILEGDGNEWQANLRLVEYDLDCQRRLYSQSGFLLEGGAMAWAFLRSIETGRNVTGHFLAHLKELAAGEDWDHDKPPTERIWGRAVETFDWDHPV